MKQKLEVYYDLKEDILEIRVGEQTECYFDEIEDDLFEAHDEKTGEFRGYKILNFSKRGGFKGIKKIQIPLPANVKIGDMD